MLYLIYIIILMKHLILITDPLAECKSAITSDEIYYSATVRGKCRISAHRSLFIYRSVTLTKGECSGARPAPSRRRAKRRWRRQSLSPNRSWRYEGLWSCTFEVFMLWGVSLIFLYLWDFLQVLVNLDEGLGVSLVNKAPEELVFTTLSGIDVHFTRTAANEVLELSIQNIQVK